MSLRVSLIPLTALLAAIAARAGDPPSPDPKHPVDYIHWMNDEYGRGITRNAADQYLAANEAFVADEAAAKIFDKRSSASSWTDDETAGVTKWISANQAALKTFAAAARTPRCYFELPEADCLLEAKMAHLQAFRALGRLTGLRARQRFMAGEREAALEDVETVIRAARHAQSQPFVISYLVGTSLDATAYQLLMRLPQLAPHETPSFKEIVKRLETIDSAPIKMFRAVQSERLILLDGAQRFLRDADGDGRYERVVFPEMLREIAKHAEMPQDPPVAFDAVVKQINALMDKFKATVTADYAAARKSAREVDLGCKESKTLLISVMAPSLTRVLELERRDLTIRNALRATLCIHAWRATRGDWPKSLDEALGREYAAYRQDPFSGKDFVYRVENGQPLLYSVGENAVDDGGKPPAEKGRVWAADGDAILWPPVTD